MRKHFLLSGLLLALLAVESTDLGAAQPAVSVVAVTTFDYPGSTSTFVGGINNRGDCVGFFSDTRGAVLGFVRYADGTFSAPIVDPKDTAHDTRPNGINARREICGSYYNLNNAVHGFTVRKSRYFSYDVPGAGETHLSAVNDAGDLAGYFCPFQSSVTFTGFVRIGETLTSFMVPGSISTSPLGLNAGGQSVGFYFDNSALPHGFLRAADGTFTYPIDFPDAGTTILAGINDRGLIVGGADGIDAFVLQLPDTFVSYDYPNASQTTFSGINKSGTIAGYYYIDGVAHGLIAQVQGL